ncbi:MAG TPA: hypothetical protein VNL77_13205 [Roseiflexaceae bacterium]|nr:hypothetical protein [Roseiflexaceae bacterium]
MKKVLTLAAVFALALLSFTSPAPAQAGDVFRFKGQSASAFFSSTDPTGCVFTDVFVFASDDALQSPPGPGGAASGAGITIFQFDVCTGTPLLDASGFSSLAPADFQVSARLNTATLNTTIEVFPFGPYPSPSFPVTINLTWTGTGALSRENSHFHFQSEGFMVNTHFNGSFRSAEASGSVSDGVTNFTPEPSSFAQIQSLKSGTVMIS